jgi:hypothetical protein
MNTPCIFCKSENGIRTKKGNSLSVFCKDCDAFFVICLPIITLTSGEQLA